MSIPQPKPLLCVDVTHSVGALRLQARFDLLTERNALFGPSGTGKTTLLRILAGLEQPEAGRVTLRGDVLVDTEKKIALPPGKRGVGMVAQQPALFPHLSVEGNLRFGLRALSQADQAARIAETAALLRIEDLLPRMPARLSGGERQRVALARALAPRPRLLLLDEPFAALDGRHKEKLSSTLQVFFATHGIGFLLVSHDVGEVWHAAETIVRMDGGRAVETGPPATMVSQERERVLAQLNSGTLQPSLKHDL